MSALGTKTGGATRYFDSKGRAEDYVRSSALTWTIFRPSLIFGPGDQFINEIGRLLRVFPILPVPGDGKYRMQPVFVGDVAKGFAEAVLNPETGGMTFEIGGPERMSYDELIDRVAAAMERRVRNIHIPLAVLRPVVRLLEEFRKFPMTTEQLEMLLMESICDSEAFYRAFNLSPLPLSGYLSGKNTGMGADKANKIPTVVKM